MSLLEALGLKAKVRCHIKNCNKPINLDKDNYTWNMDDTIICESCSTKIAKYKKWIKKRELAKIVAFNYKKAG